MTNEQAEREADRKAWLSECIGEIPEEVRLAVEDGGGTFRITKRNGHALICTRDHNPNRVNVEVDGGVVTAAYYG